MNSTGISTTGVLSFPPLAAKSSFYGEAKAVSSEPLVTGDPAQVSSLSLSLVLCRRLILIGLFNCVINTGRRSQADFLFFYFFGPLSFPLLFFSLS